MFFPTIQAEKEQKPNEREQDKKTGECQQIKGEQANGGKVSRDWTEEGVRPFFLFTHTLMEGINTHTHEQHCMVKNRL